MTAPYLMNLKEILTKYLPKSDNVYRFPYINTIEIKGKDSDTLFWIRVAPYYPKPCSITFASVILDDSLRNKGVFRKIVQALRENPIVGKIYISSPSTDDMHKACKALGMTYSEAFDHYSFPQDDAKITAHFI